MRANLLNLYHRLPYPARSAAASMWGYYLNWWRYGAETERLVEQALENERLGSQELKSQQNERLEYILTRAVTKVPYYREQWEGKGDAWKSLGNWKVLRKDALRAYKDDFLAEDKDTKQLFLEHTSGTTGTPVTLWCERSSLKSWYALSEARWKRWYGVSRNDRWAIIGGQKVVPFQQEKPPFWVWNAGLNQLYMSSMHIKPEFLKHYLTAIQRYKIVYLYGYSSALYWLAVAALENKVQLNLKVVITNAEPLYDFQREVMEKAFNCPVRETYGLSEMVCAMSECEEGKLHLWTEAGAAEILDENDQPVKRGETGRLVCTGLLNEAMPLIRYEVMDMAQFPEVEEACACGRNLPVVKKVLGRLDDQIVTKDGRKLALLDIIFGEHLHIKEAQIVQETLDLLRIRVVPAEGWSEWDEAEIKSSVFERMGDVQVQIETVPEIERTFAGKLRVMISKVNSQNTVTQIATHN